MKLFEDLKKTIVGEKMPEKPIMKVTMLGARGVGKTSVLTSMYRNMNSAVNDTRLHITAQRDTSVVLGKKIEDLKKMFFEQNNIDDKVHGGIAGDMTVSVFDFDFGLNTEKVNMGLQIKDFPGEYVLDEPQTVREFIDESSAVLVAIDTPHLMECGGKYNEAKNRTQMITDFFKETMRADDAEKLIVLIPLKCEKYYHNGEIEKVRDKVKETYKELITFLRDRKNENGLKGKFACVIAPILTVGEIVFDDFARQDGAVKEVRLADGTVVPEEVRYKYLKAGAEYQPQYCDQPLFYLLSFVSKQYLKMKEAHEQSGWIGKLKKRFALTPKIDEMLLEIQKFQRKKVDNVNGFETCFGRGKV